MLGQNCTPINIQCSGFTVVGQFEILGIEIHSAMQFKHIMKRT